MQFRDLQKQYEVLKPRMDEAMISVAASSKYIGGPQVKELEDRLAKYVGVKHCIACANGTDALQLALMAWGVGPGDAVFVPDFTFFSTGEVVSAIGATPVFYDVCADTFNADADSLEKAILAVKEEGKLIPKAVTDVDLFGLPADHGAIEAVAKKYGLYMLEDAAQGFGGAYHGKRNGAFGDMATTSFFPAKPLGCYGDGGAVFTNDDDTAALIRSLCVHGKGTMKYDNVRIGMNSRLDTIQAAILLVKMDAFESYELDDVNEVARWYNEALAGMDVILPTVPERWLSSWAQYTIRLKDASKRDAVQAALKAKGIPTMVYYPKPMHTQLAFAGNRVYVDCPVTDELCATVLSLPMHPYMDARTVETVAAALREALTE
ncbi:MAG: DegT/DnrJ/EryC1/StrS family aminotransferase [Oscillospiraceae bacterium]|nr:DegT/DnrJ/EryC1/StrS family aminotransferase [Oscillospiraceae bacterium]